MRRAFIWLQYFWLVDQIVFSAPSGSGICLQFPLKYEYKYTAIVATGALDVGPQQSAVSLYTQVEVSTLSSSTAVVRVSYLDIFSDLITKDYSFGISNLMLGIRWCFLTICYSLYLFSNWWNSSVDVSWQL